MVSPFPPSTSSPGRGNLTAHLLPHSISALSTLTFQYPLKLISPSPSHSPSVLVFLLTYGGGLVGGDSIHLTITVLPSARLSIVTQGHTKIFKSPSKDVVTGQKLEVEIGEGGAVCLLPDPVQPFAGSFYEQNQAFKLGEGASLCLLDWFSAGRTARGEDWDFGSWKGRNEVWSLATEEQKERLILRDNILLQGDGIGASEKALKKKMHGLGIFGTLVLRGPLVEQLGEFFLSEFLSLPRIGGRDFRSQERQDQDSGTNASPRESWRQTRLKHEKADDLLWSAAKVRGCTVVKFGARTVEGGRNWIGAMVKEEGSIEREFGADALMCIR
jgi:urease accessory protein